MANEDSEAYEVGTRLWLKAEQEVVLVRQVIRKRKEVEHRVPHERIRVKQVRPEMETWYKVEVIRNAQELFRRADSFRPCEEPRDNETEEDS